MGLTKGQAYNYKAKLKSILRPMTNPFTGSKISITKRIMRKTFDSNQEKYKDFIYDPEKDCDHNEWFTIVTNGTEYILIKEAYGE